MAKKKKELSFLKTCPLCGKPFGSYLESIQHFCTAPKEEPKTIPIGVRLDSYNMTEAFHRALNEAEEAIRSLNLDGDPWRMGKWELVFMRVLCERESWRDDAISYRYDFGLKVTK